MRHNVNEDFLLIFLNFISISVYGSLFLVCLLHLFLSRAASLAKQFFCKSILSVEPLRPSLGLSRLLSPSVFYFLILLLTNASSFPMACPDNWSLFTCFVLDNLFLIMSLLVTEYLNM